MRALGADLLACSPYKFYGPHTGVLWGRRELLESLDVPKLQPGLRRGAGATRDGDPQPRGDRRDGSGRRVSRLARGAGRAPGLPGAERSRRSTRGERRSFERMWEGLGAVPGVTLYGPPPGAPRTPTVAFASGRARLRRRRRGAGEARRLRHARRLLRDHPRETSRPRGRRPRPRRLRLLHDRGGGRPARRRRQEIAGAERSLRDAERRRDLSLARAAAERPSPSRDRG